MAGQQRKLPEKGYRGAHERYKQRLEDNGAEIMMHGDEIYLREWGNKGWMYTH